jgi:hypothetical protein
MSQSSTDPQADYHRVNESNQKIGDNICNIGMHLLKCGCFVDTKANSKGTQMNAVADGRLDVLIWYSVVALCFWHKYPFRCPARERTNQVCACALLSFRLAPFCPPLPRLPPLPARLSPFLAFSRPSSPHPLCHPLHMPLSSSHLLTVLTCPPIDVPSCFWIPPYTH